jgi:hypothetical protein
LAAGRRLERQVRADGQRRRGRSHRAELAGRTAGSRLRSGQHRYGSSGRGRRFRVGRRPSREADRLRVSLHSRAHARGEGDHRGALRHGACEVVLARLFDGWAPGLEDGAAVPRRLRRDHRGRTRRELGAVDVPERNDSARLDRARWPGRRQAQAAQGSDDCGVRWSRWRSGSRHHGS